MVPNTTCPTILWEYYSSPNKMIRDVTWIVKVKAYWLDGKRKETV